MNASLLKSCKHLADYSTNEIIKNVGLYEPILVNTYSNTQKLQGQNMTVQISPDLKSLFALLMINSPLCLPCANCKKELAFNQLVDFDINKSSHALVNLVSKLPSSDQNNYNPNQFYFFSDAMFWGGRAITESDIQKINSVCKKTIENTLSFFLLELVCTLNSSHTIRCMFSLTQFKQDDDSDKAYREALLKELKSRIDPEIALELSDADRKNIEMGKLADQTLVLTKVGQYPSLADMQNFELRKYQKVLKENYQELTKAVGLFASGIGIGAFVYLRRVYERLCENIHITCSAVKGWDEAKYQKLHFNEKLDYLGEFGNPVLPDELAQIKTKLYGVLSKGVHEYTDEECQELFPYLQIAIELLLDKQLEKIEREKKLSEATMKISNART